MQFILGGYYEFSIRLQVHLWTYIRFLYVYFYSWQKCDSAHAFLIGIKHVEVDNRIAHFDRFFWLPIRLPFGVTLLNEVGQRHSPALTIHKCRTFNTHHTIPAMMVLGSLGIRKWARSSACALHCYRNSVWFIKCTHCWQLLSPSNPTRRWEEAS